MDKEKEPTRAKAKAPPAPAPKREIMTALRIVARRGETALVEWQPKGCSAQRGCLPFALVDGKTKLAQSELDQAEPYGVNWEVAIELPLVTERSLADALHKYGIWSVDDVRHESVKARQALAEAYMIGVLQLLKVEDK